MAASDLAEDLCQQIILRDVIRFSVHCGLCICDQWGGPVCIATEVLQLSTGYPQARFEATCLSFSWFGRGPPGLNNSKVLVILVCMIHGGVLLEVDVTRRSIEHFIVCSSQMHFSSLFHNLIHQFHCGTQLKARPMLIGVQENDLQNMHSVGGFHMFQRYAFDWCGVCGSNDWIVVWIASIRCKWERTYNACGTILWEVCLLTLISLTLTELGWSICNIYHQWGQLVVPQYPRIAMYRKPEAVLDTTGGQFRRDMRP